MCGCRALYISMDDRSDWDSLVAQLVPLIRKLVALSQHHSSVTIVAESFGGCLALRLALAVPELIDQMVLVNPATCFKQSYLGITGLVARTNLLSLFPERLYQVSCRLWTGRRAIVLVCGVVLAGGAPGAQRGERGFFCKQAEGLPQLLSWQGAGCTNLLSLILSACIRLPSRLTQPGKAFGEKRVLLLL